MTSADLMAAAAAYHLQGLAIVPALCEQKRPAVRWGEIAAMAREGDRLPAEQMAGMFRAANHADAIGHVILRGYAILDCDTVATGTDWETFLRPGPGPTVSTPRGYHFLLRTRPGIRLPVNAGGAAHFLGPGRFALLPPSGGRTWLRPLAAAMPSMTAELVEAMRRQGEEASVTAPSVEGELAAYRALLPDLRGSGPWRATCPFHTDVSPSLGVYVTRTGRMLWRCFAETCGKSGTRAYLAHLLGAVDPQYEEARRMIEAQSWPTDVKEALRWAVGVAAKYGLDLQAPDGIGASFRQLAAATGIESVVGVFPGRLQAGGRDVRRLLRRIERAGVPVVRGAAHAPGIRGRTTRLVLASLLEDGPADGACYIRSHSNVTDC